SGLVRVFGLREIATGLGILGARRRAARRWVWARVAGDALDLGLLATSALASRVDPRLSSAAVATANVLAVTALDVAAALG
ncbi:MAG TPA: hypothetical protein VHB21_24515, partial [Minicystis sp.]|nr:hypothetical protein [Minicystis sp.]